MFNLKKGVFITTTVLLLSAATVGTYAYYGNADQNGGYCTGNQTAVSLMTQTRLQQKQQLQDDDETKNSLQTCLNRQLIGNGNKRGLGNCVNQ
ncbi:MAG: hypothetical protein VB012_03625 [Erysipelotrichaceae bacterium]|nr:hypothetical protein [Erysipelotrichaceae bacterium]